MPGQRPIYAVTRFRKTWRSLSAKQKLQIIEIIIALPEFMGNPHAHSGFGFRRLHGSAFHEARLDLRWRLIMRISDEDIILFDVMNHDQVRRL
jgi:mRNA-degrading endonuclease RelE of RelBE toxin-antitoxin system